MNCPSGPLDDAAVVLVGDEESRHWLGRWRCRGGAHMVHLSAVVHFFQLRRGFGSWALGTLTSRPSHCQRARKVPASSLSSLPRGCLRSLFPFGPSTQDRLRSLSERLRQCQGTFCSSCASRGTRDETRGGRDRSGPLARFRLLRTSRSHRFLSEPLFAAHFDVDLLT